MVKQLKVVQSENLIAQFESLKQTYWPRVRALIDEVISESSTPDSLLYQMAHYHLDSGGKRLRAVLPLMIGQSLGYDANHLVPFGAACEMLHNASLVHDDIQDGDALRRGRVAVWSQFGQAQAINLGDAMIAYTMRLLQRLNVSVEIHGRVSSRVILEMLRVIDGQVQDLHLKSEPDVSVDEYIRMVEGKTARLFALPICGAAALCDGTNDLEIGLQEAANQIGVLYQIQDDVMDVFGQGTVGYRASDLRNGKRNLLAVHGLAHASTAEMKWLIKVLEKPREATSERDISQVKDLYLRIGSLAYAMAELGRRREAALSVSVLAEYPQLQRVLAGACQLFLNPVTTLVADMDVATCV